jgi:hypothetical protein
MPVRPALNCGVDDDRITFGAAPVLFNGAEVIVWPIRAEPLLGFVNFFPQPQPMSGSFNNDVDAFAPCAGGDYFVKRIFQKPRTNDLRPLYCAVRGDGYKGGCPCNALVNLLACHVVTFPLG